jgi:hypothetical protein
MDKDRWFVIPGLVVARRVKTQLFLYIPKGSCSPSILWGKYEVKKDAILQQLRAIYHSISTGESVAYATSNHQESAASFVTISKEVACSPQVSFRHKIAHPIKVHVNKHF